MRFRPALRALLPSGKRRPLAAAALLVTTAFAVPALATNYWTLPTLLKDFFSASKKVTYKKVSLSEADAKEIAKKLGEAQIKREWNVYFGEQADGTRDGFAIQDAQIGLHEPIDFAVRFTPAGAVARVEIMEYREAYGGEVRSERFRAQFVGKTPKDPIVAGRDVDIISGATYSSKSVALGVKRDTLVLEAALKNGSLQ